MLPSSQAEMKLPSPILLRTAYVCLVVAVVCAQSTTSNNICKGEHKGCKTVYYGVGDETQGRQCLDACANKPDNLTEQTTAYLCATPDVACSTYKVRGRSGYGKNFERHIMCAQACEFVGKVESSSAMSFELCRGMREKCVQIERRNGNFNEFRRCISECDGWAIPENTYERTALLCLKDGDCQKHSYFLKPNETRVFAGLASCLKTCMPANPFPPITEESNGLEDNLITSTEKCVSMVANLPEKATHINVDSRYLYCDGKRCRAAGDDYISVDYKQEKVGSHYLAEANLCRYDKIFRIAWEVEGIQVKNRLARITQFLVPNGDWLATRIGCIQPQYSLPLIRNITAGSNAEFQCAISKQKCYGEEDVVIFDQNRVFCEYSKAVRTCERKQLDDEIVIFSTPIFKTEPNSHWPEQYVFCNSLRSDVSIKFTWN